MSRWQLNIPFTSRDQSPIEALAANADARLEGDDRRVATEFLLAAAVDPGIGTVGDLIDRVERADPAERRRILDEAREAAGLESASDVEAHERFEAAQRTLRPRPPQRCVVCGVTPTTREGFPDLTVPAARKWHCRDHQHLAEPGDMEAPPLPIDPRTMRVFDPDEIARQRHEDEKLAAAAEERRLVKEHEAAERAAAKRAVDEAWQPSGPGWRP